MRDRGVSGSVVGLAFEEAPSEPRPQGSAELSDLVVDHLRKRRTTTASPTPTALLGAPGPEGTPSRLRLGRMSVQETTFDGVPMALLATHRNESLSPAVAQAFLPAAPRFVSALFAGARASHRFLAPGMTFERVD